MPSESASFPVGVTLRGRPRAGYSPQGRVAAISVGEEQLGLHLNGPDWLLESSGVCPDYAFRRDEIVDIVMSWSGSLTIVHQADAPELVRVSGERDLTRALQAAGYPVRDSLGKLSAARRAIVWSLVAVEACLIVAMVVTSDLAFGLAVVALMPLVAIAVWRLQPPIR